MFRFNPETIEFSLLQSVNVESGAYPDPYWAGASVSFSGDKATECEDDHSLPLSVEVKNECTYNSTFPYEFMLIRGTDLTLYNIPVVHLFLSSDEKLKIGPTEPNIVIWQSM